MAEAKADLEQLSLGASSFGPGSDSRPFRETQKCCNFSTVSRRPSLALALCLVIFFGPVWWSRPFFHSLIDFSDSFGQPCFLRRKYYYNKYLPQFLENIVR